MAHAEIKKEIEESLDRFYDRDGESTPIIKYKGIAYSFRTCLPDALSQLHLLELHKDDIIISAYPCSVRLFRPTREENTKKIMAHEEIKKEIEESLDRFYDRDGESTPILKYKDIAFPAMNCLPDALSQLHLLELHKDDIIISAYPCSGTHWMWEVTSMLLKNKAERIQGVKEEVMLEFVPPNQFADIPPPRVFNTHVQPHFLPETVLSQNKIIFVVRNPKDVVVSYYRHTFGMYYKEYNGTFPSFFEMFMEKKLPFGDIFDFMNKWWPIIKDNPNFLVVSYEEASQNLLKTVNKIGDFLGRVPNPKLAADIAELCTFDNMKKTKKATMNNISEQELWKPNYSFYRKGKVATWKEWLTVSQSERMDALIKTELSNCGIPITYTI